MCACALAASLALSLAPPADKTKKALTVTQIAALVRQLGDDRFERREAASRALADAGESALGAVRKAAASEDVEVRRRAGRLLSALRATLVAREWEKLKGDWVVEAKEEAGVRAELPAKDTFRVSLQPGPERSKTFPTPGESAQGAELYTWEVLDPTCKPAAVNLRRGKDIPLAIYKLQGDQLIVCLDNSDGGSSRPTSFTTRRGDGRRLLTFKRLKLAGPSPEPPPKAPEPPALPPPPPGVVPAGQGALTP